MRKRFSVIAMVVIAMMMVVPAVLAANAAPVFDSLVTPLPPSLVSQPFQAQQTDEFGDHIQFAGAQRVLDQVTVTMVTWAPQASYPDMTDPDGWMHPITLNIYNVDYLGAVPELGTSIFTATESFLIPWRPAADPACGSAWKAADGTCYNGFAFNITFDLSSYNFVLPEEIIYGIAYNTQTWGYFPIGQPGPYNSLNIGLNATGTAPSVGVDVEPDAVFWNTHTAKWYADGGSGGVGEFRRDTGWTGYVPTIRFEAQFADPSNMDDCKNGGWQDYGFKNQGDCVSFVRSNPNSNK